MNIDSVKINTSLIMIRQWTIFWGKLFWTLSLHHKTMLKVINLVIYAISGGENLYCHTSWTSDKSQRSENSQWSEKEWLGMACFHINVEYFCSVQCEMVVGLHCCVTSACIVKDIKGSTNKHFIEKYFTGLLSHVSSGIGFQSTNEKFWKSEYNRLPTIYLIYTFWFNH